RSSRCCATSSAISCSRAAASFSGSSRRSISRFHSGILGLLKPVPCSFLSFVSEGDHGIHFHCTTRRNVARGERDQRQQNRDAGESQRIVGVNSVKHAGHE